MLSYYGLLDSSINTCTFATDGTGDITVAGAHGLSANQEVRFSTTSALPAELNRNGRYFVLSSGLTSTKLRIAATAGGTLITFATAGTGTHTIWKSTLSGEYEQRGQDPIPPGRLTQAPTGSWVQSGALDTQIGTCSFNGATIIVSVAHGLSPGQTVRFDAMFPPPLTSGVYYVLNSGLTNTQLQVATTPLGTPIDFGVTPNDVWLYPVASPVVLRTQRATIFKSALNAVVTGGFGWYANAYVFGWIQNLVLTASESLSLSEAARTSFVYGSATESLVIADHATIPGHFSVSETLVIAEINVAHAPNLFRDTFVGTPLGITLDPVVTLPRMRTVDMLLSLFEEAHTDAGPSLSAAEALSLSVVAARPGEVNRRSSESFLIAVAVHEAHILHRIVFPFIESLGTSDAARRSLAALRAATHALSLSEFASGAQGALATCVESLLTSDLAVVSSFGRGRTAAETLAVAELASVIFSRSYSATESLAVADLATILGTRLASATEHLSLADLASVHFGRLRSATEALHIVDNAFFGGFYQRKPVESLHVAELAARHVTLLRRAIEALQILVAARGRQHFKADATERLLIEQFAAWITGPHDPWEYYLDLTTGNLPVESNLEVPQAESIASAPEAESSASAPEAESELVGSVADSGGFRYIDP